MFGSAHPVGGLLEYHMIAEIIRRHAASTGRDTPGAVRCPSYDHPVANRTIHNIALREDRYPLDNSEFTTIEGLAVRIQRTPATIRWWISQGTEIGPAFRRVGKRRLARTADCDRWLAEKFGEAATC